MKKKDEMDRDETEKLVGNVLRLNAKVLALVLGLLFGIAIFIATNWLLIKDGDPVGPHLQLLSQYFIGYRVSFRGSLVGFAYGAFLGSASGLLLGWIYNWMVLFTSKEKSRTLIS